jgi:CheY-like chemotaxis protein
LISDLLDLSRIVSDKLRLDIQAIDLAAIVRAAVDTVQPDASARRIQILSQVDEHLTPMAGDPARLQQVIWNLLSNAVKFTPVGGTVRVTLRCRGAQADVIVSDNGIGISPGFLPYVFDRFQQADVSRTRRVGGLGLGLSIVKTLVELHDGTVSAASPGAGQGATFTVSLPIADPPIPPLAVTTATPMTGLELTDTVSLAGIHILTVEDDPDAADLVRRLLESRGARVSVAATAARALEHFAREVPDILISDISLPEIDGYDLMEKVRTRSPAEGGAVPAIALTAYARSEDRTRALLAGYQAHLAKPIAADELLAAVSSFAELARAGRSGESV